MSVMSSRSFRDIVAPLLNEAFDGVYEQRDDEYRSYMDVKPGIKRTYHQDVVLYGFPLAPELPDGTAVEYRSGGELYNAIYVYKVYGLAFALTKVLVEDGDHIRMGPSYAEHLSQSMIETKETVSANIINRAFNAAYPGGDGVALVANNHPDAIGSVPGAPSTSTLLTSAAFSQTSLEASLIQSRKSQDATGRRIRLRPMQLIASPDNEFQMEVVLKSVLRAGTPNNDINPIRSKGLLAEGSAIISRLTSTTAWWVQTNTSRGLRLMTRRDMEKSMEGDFATDSMRYKATERYAPGWTDWKNIYGNSGV